MLNLEDLRTMVDDGRVDTVLVAFTDMQGRLQGKRCHARYFLDEVLAHTTEACNYLLAVDVEMNTVDGYAMSSWEQGYGDFVLRPDLATLRLVPWHEGTALVLCDIEWHDGSPGRRLAPPGAAPPARPPGRARPRRPRRHRARVHRVPRHLRGGVGQAATAACSPANQYNVDYSLAGTARIEHAAAPHPQRDGRRRPVRRVGQGRVQPRPARDRLPLRRRPDDLRQPQRCTRRAPRRSPPRRA